MGPLADPGALPPTQEMAAQVLAARYRLGENAWTFPNRVRPALAGLAARGLAWWKWATIPGHCIAGLTPAGLDAYLLDSYRAPGRPPLPDVAALLTRAVSDPGSVTGRHIAPGEWESTTAWQVRAVQTALDRAGLGVVPVRGLP
jgi:hypothetical protein